MKPIDNIDQQYHLDDSLFGECKSCGHTCRARIEDESFDHAFGTHHDHVVLSDCCDGFVKLDRASERNYENIIYGKRRRRYAY